MSLLDLRHVSKSFPLESGIFHQRLGSVRALADVSFSVDSGQTVALVGGSGSGKSTLAKVITGLVPADTGTCLWEGQPLESFSQRERAQRVQMIFQDPFASLNPKLSIGTQLREVVRLLGEPDSYSRCMTLLEQVGLPADAMSHYPFQFSGGQRQRIAIARALAMQPKLLIADEPLSALDVTTQAQILGLFAQLKKTYSLAFLFITHDLAVANAFSDRIVVLKDGQIVEEGPTPSVLRNPQDTYTRSLLAAVPKIPW